MKITEVFDEFFDEVNDTYDYIIELVEQGKPLDDNKTALMKKAIRIESLLSKYKQTLRYK